MFFESLPRVGTTTRWTGASICVRARDARCDTRSRCAANRFPCRASSSSCAVIRSRPSSPTRIGWRASPPRRSRDVYCYFDHDAKVKAPFDALRLAQMLDIDWASAHARDGAQWTRRRAGRSTESAARESADPKRPKRRVRSG
jgi:hypothetical protein